jgi:HD superfamily phosphohydrolase
VNPHRTYEFRCPVHGFIPVNDWERDIINHPTFQRLRRIRQLAWTDYVYPGAMHTRFEHSLGVMHLATKVYDSIVERSRSLLERLYGYDEAGFRRDKALVRLAALLHDVGHSPFSHAGEEVFPLRDGGKKRYVHEEYSAAIIRHLMKDVIENHPLNGNYEFKADDVAALIEGSSQSARRIFWRDIITGQMDADRMDYLLRDSLHAGVDYGKYDWRRLLNTVVAIEMPESEEETGRRGLRLGVAESGIHAAEGLILARYFMFTQVYFHKTRVAYDHHLKHALAELLPGGVFPPLHAGSAKERTANLEKYIGWDDWKVLGLLADGKGGEHGGRLCRRNHYREVYNTPECPGADDLIELKRVEEGLKEDIVAREEAGKSWYKVDDTDIPVVGDGDTARVLPLSKLSPIVGSVKATRRVSLFATPERARDVRAKVANLLKGSAPRT